MLQNVGGVDRVIRVVLGVGIIVAGVATQSWWGLLGLIPLATAAVGVCPLYLPFGIRTRRLPKNN